MISPKGLLSTLEKELPNDWVIVCYGDSFKWTPYLRSFKWQYVAGLAIAYNNHGYIDDGGTILDYQFLEQLQESGAFLKDHALPCM